MNANDTGVGLSCSVLAVHLCGVMRRDSEGYLSGNVTARVGCGWALPTASPVA